MAQPTILGEGTDPRVRDTQWRTLVKIVGAAYNSAANPNPSNVPRFRDTRYKLLLKLNNLAN